MSLRWIPLLCGSACVTSAQPPSQDPAQVLLAARQKVMQTVRRLPLYLCRETVERTTFEAPLDLSAYSCAESLKKRQEEGLPLRETTSDRLRLDVAVSADSEMFSWAGENQFRNRSLAALVGSGATQTGTFGSFLISIFGTDAATFTYNGDISSDNRELMEFGFRVGREKSRFVVENSVHREIVPYDGTFLVDPKSFDLVRLKIHPAELPEELRTCDSSTTLTYGVIQLNDSKFLIPTDASWHVIQSDGSAIHSRITFSACHEFLGESTLRFDAGPAGDAGARKPDQPAFQVPSGRSFSVALANPINTAIAAAGDPFQAALVRPIRGKGNRIVLPGGAIVTGRIVRMERLYDLTGESVLVALRLESVWSDGASNTFHATLRAEIRRHSKSSQPPGRPQELGSFEAMTSGEDAAMGMFRFERVKTNFVIPRGFQIDGVTADPSGG